jgi:hypothetical protein
MEPLLYDLSTDFGNKRARKKRIRAYEAAWARLQHEQPGFAQTAADAAFQNVLIAWLRSTRRSPWLALAYAWNPLVILEIAQEPAVGVRVAFGPPRRGIVHAGDRSAAGRKEQRVEALRAAVAQAQLPVRVVDADGRIDDELSTGLFREAL